MFAADVDKTKIIFLRSPSPLDRSGRGRRRSAVEPLRFQNAPEAVAVAVGQKMRDQESEILYCYFVRCLPADRKAARLVG
jgi:hypothetical protein